MRIVHLNHERKAKCSVCKCKLAYNPKDLNNGLDGWFVSCPNCGRSVEVRPSRRFLRYRELYIESLRKIGQDVDF
jgi:hypothetical protein